MEGSHLSLQMPNTTKRKKKANAVKRRARIRTSTPIPSDVKHFSFQIMANAESVGKDISLGYTTRNKSVLYEGEKGLISKEFFDIDWDYNETYFWKNMYHKKEIENVEKFEEENDIIRCEFERKIVMDRHYGVIYIKKNGIIIGKQALELDGDEIWPFVALGYPGVSVQVDINKEENEQDSGMCFFHNIRIRVKVFYLD